MGVYRYVSVEHKFFSGGTPTVYVPLALAYILCRGESISSAHNLTNHHCLYRRSLLLPYVGEKLSLLATQLLHLSEVDIKIFDWLFTQCGPNAEGTLGGKDIRGLMRSSQLSNPQLAAIWEKVTCGQARLTRAAFYVMLVMVAAVQRGYEPMAVTELFQLKEAMGKPQFSGISYAEVTKLIEQSSSETMTAAPVPLASSTPVVAAPEVHAFSPQQQHTQHPQYQSLGAAVLSGSSMMAPLTTTAPGGPNPTPLSVTTGTTFVPPRTTIEYLDATPEDQPLPGLVVSPEMAQAYIRSFAMAVQQYGMHTSLSPGVPPGVVLVNESAANYFTRTGLPPAAIARAWKLGHIYSPVQQGVDQVGFIIAMHLCRLMHSKALPDAPHALSHALLVSARAASGVPPDQLMLPVPMHLLLVEAPEHIQRAHDLALKAFLSSTTPISTPAVVPLDLSQQKSVNLQPINPSPRLDSVGGAVGAPAPEPHSATFGTMPAGLASTPAVTTPAVGATANPPQVSTFALPGMMTSPQSDVSAQYLPSATSLGGQSGSFAPKSEAPTFGTSAGFSERELEIAELHAEEASLRSRLAIASEQKSQRSAWLDSKQQELEETRQRVAKARAEVEALERECEELKEKADELRAAILDERYQEERLDDQQGAARLGVLAAKQALEEVHRQAAHTLELRNKANEVVEQYTAELSSIRSQVIAELKRLVPSSTDEDLLTDEIESLFKPIVIPLELDQGQKHSKQPASVSPQTQVNQGFDPFADWGHSATLQPVTDTVDIFSGFGGDSQSGDAAAAIPVASSKADDTDWDAFGDAKQSTPAPNVTPAVDEKEIIGKPNEEVSLIQRVLAEKDPQQQAKIIHDCLVSLPLLTRFAAETSNKQLEAEQTRRLLEASQQACFDLAQEIQKLTTERQECMTKVEELKAQQEKMLLKKANLEQQIRLLRDGPDDSSSPDAASASTTPPLSKVQALLREQAAANIALEREIERLKKVLEDSKSTASEETLVDLHRHQLLKARHDTLQAEANRLRQLVPASAIAASAGPVVESLSVSPSSKLPLTTTLSGDQLSIPTPSSTTSKSLSSEGANAAAANRTLVKLPSIITNEVRNLSSTVLPQGMTVAQVDAALTDDWEIDVQSPVVIDPLAVQASQIDLSVFSGGKMASQQLRLGSNNDDDDDEGNPFGDDADDPFGDVPKPAPAAAMSTATTTTTGAAPLAQTSAPKVIDSFGTTPDDDDPFASSQSASSTAAKSTVRHSKPEDDWEW